MYIIIVFESNIHKIYKLYILNGYLKYDNNNKFKLETNKEIDINNIFYTKHWFPNINLSHNLPFVAGIAGYHFMIWFAVFYLNINDWSFLITVCNDILLLICLFTALLIIFYLTLVLLGIDSAFSIVEAISTVIADSE